MNALPLSVIVCTYNRRQTVAQCLDGLIAQTLPASDFEVIVVDNGSTDGTAELLAGYGRRMGAQLRTLWMEAPSANAARNLGIREARGKRAAFLDDDAVADPSWAAEIVKAFESNGAVVAVGGPIRVKFDNDPPSWLTPEHRHLLCAFDLGPQPRNVGSWGTYLVNANFAVDRDAVTREAGFHPGLDRFGDHLLSGGEVDLQRRLKARGGELLYWPGARIVHHIRADRLDDSYFKRRFYWQGATESRMARLSGRRVELAWLVAIRLPLMAKTGIAVAVMTALGRADRARLFRHFLNYFTGFYRETLLPHRFESRPDEGSTVAPRAS